MSQSPRSLRTDLGRVRHLGSARSGTGHLWAMRVTSAALLPLTVGFVWLVLSLVGKDYNTVRATLASPLAAILLLGFVLTGVYHMMLGMRVIIEDYVPNAHSREWALIVNMAASALIGLACVYAILKISFV